MNQASVLPAANRATCASCRWRTLCLPAGLAGGALDEFERAVAQRRPVARHERVEIGGAPFGQLHAVLSGQFKLQRAAPDGGVQVLGFAMPGDLMGLDAIGTGRYANDAVALSDSVICSIAYSALESLMAQQPALARRLSQLLSASLAQRQDQMLFLGNARAPQRLARLLLDLGGRYGERGGSATEFQLCMSREDLAAYLALTVESVSRLLSMFKQNGLLAVSNRAIALLDTAGLRAIAAAPPQGVPAMHAA
jgi:CRP/FNR family transcriptional regulator, anaerobic regulatory protein